MDAASVVCALREDGTLDCAPSIALPGQFTSFDVGDGGDTVCGIRPDKTLACTPPRALWADPPTGTFEHVACAGQFCCAIPTEGDIVCWGGTQTSGELDAPRGPFASLRASSLDAVRRSRRRHPRLLESLGHLGGAARERALGALARLLRGYRFRLRRT
jgi:hypothetical protein